MKNFALVKMLSLVWAASLFTCGCVVDPNAPVATLGTEVHVPGEPPLDILEAVPPCPGADFVWIGGAWGWQGRWVWEKGHWDRPPNPGAVWVPHQYASRNGSHVFIRGGWRNDP
jgi:hypothetical protein